MWTHDAFGFYKHLDLLSNGMSTGIHYLEAEPCKHFDDLRLVRDDSIVAVASPGDVETTPWDELALGWPQTFADEIDSPRRRPFEGIGQPWHQKSLSPYVRGGVGIDDSVPRQEARELEDLALKTLPERDIPPFRRRDAGRLENREPRQYLDQEVEVIVVATAGDHSEQAIHLQRRFGKRVQEDPMFAPAGRTPVQAELLDHPVGAVDDDAMWAQDPAFRQFCHRHTRDRHLSDL